MRNPVIVFCVLFLTAGILADLARSQGNSNSELERVIAEALKPSPLEANLQRLTDTIGGRIPGTPAMEKAVDWGVAAFKAAGADNVRVEKFDLQSSWSEGDTRMSVAAPAVFSVRAISLAWAPPLPPQKHV
ncbi:MAG TPA: hypothetical protein VGF08_07770, partial [Terriglobales bacterium]